MGRKMKNVKSWDKIKWSEIYENILKPKEKREKVKSVLLKSLHNSSIIETRKVENFRSIKRLCELQEKLLKVIFGDFPRE